MVVKLYAYDLTNFTESKYKKIYEMMDTQERRYMTSLKYQKLSVYLLNLR